MKDVWFNLLALAIGTANVCVFILIKIQGTVYVYDNTPVIYLEILLFVAFAVWAMVRLISGTRGMH